MHLYHFLLRYPGKTLVFLSSIDGIRRLHPLISVLNLGEVGLLHSGMQQKARLKALDRFTNSTSSTSVLLCTDVAARGLDIASVHHVVHYQLPRTADTYVHRSGRTARAGREGVSLQLVSPEEKSLQRELFKSLGRGMQCSHFQMIAKLSVQMSGILKSCRSNGALWTDSRIVSTWRGKLRMPTTKSPKRIMTKNGYVKLPKRWNSIWTIWSE